MSKYRIDINCDMGESYGHFKVGNDSAIFPYITSCNIACGFHSGDPLHIQTTIKNALKHKVQIGAHPSYPDLAGFGRRKMSLSTEELKAVISYQIAAIKGLTESNGGKLLYVKPHGALYNTMAVDEQEALTVIESVKEMDANLTIVGLAGSIVEQLAGEQGVKFIAEAFADRRYDDEGHLMSRLAADAVIENPQDAVDQVLSIVLDRKVKSHTGKAIQVKAQSICMHGDNPQVVALLKSIDQALEKNNIKKKAFET